MQIKYYFAGGPERIGTSAKRPNISVGIKGLIRLHTHISFLSCFAVILKKI